MKPVSFFLLILILSCTKDVTNTPPPDISPVEGTYLCNLHTEYRSFQDSQMKIIDTIIQMKLIKENDSSISIKAPNVGYNEHEIRTISLKKNDSIFYFSTPNYIRQTSIKYIKKKDSIYGQFHYNEVPALHDTMCFMTFKGKKI